MNHSNPITVLSMLATGAALALGGGAASAGTLDSVASYQITSFSYVVTGGTLSWLPGSAYQTLYSESSEAGGLVDNDLQSSTDFALTNASLSTSRAHAAALAAATADGTVRGSAQATPFVVSDVSQPHAGVSMAQQSQEFTLSQSGSVTFTIAYSLIANAVTGNAHENYAQAALDFAFGNYANASGGAQNITLFSFDGLDGQTAQSGTLTFTVDFASGGEVGYYNLRGNAWASASASVAVVPEPESYALMLAGLALVGLVARRRGARALR